MSLVAVHIIEINGTDAPVFAAINTEKISELGERNGKAYFNFSPIAGRKEVHIIEESMSVILNSPVQSSDAEVTFNLANGTLTVNKSDIIKVYPADAPERCYINVVVNGLITGYMLKHRLWEVVATVNMVS